jgi:hypothetical protein
MSSLIAVIRRLLGMAVVKKDEIKVCDAIPSADEIMALARYHLDYGGSFARITLARRHLLRAKSLYMAGNALTAQLANEIETGLSMTAWIDRK